MSETPAPPPFAAYPRGTSGEPTYGSAERLQALCDGYYGLSNVFGLNILLALGTRFVSEVSLAALGIFALAMFLIVGGLTYPQNKRIAVGKGWPPSNAILASVLMGLNSALCCGVIGYAVMQTIALNEIKRYGVKRGFFGIKKADVQKRVAELRSVEAGVTPPPAFGV